MDSPAVGPVSRDLWAKWEGAYQELCQRAMSAYWFYAHEVDPNPYRQKIADRGQVESIDKDWIQIGYEGEYFDEHPGDAIPTSWLFSNDWIGEVRDELLRKAAIEAQKKAEEKEAKRRLQDDYDRREYERLRKKFERETD